MESSLQAKAYHRVRQGLLLGEWGDGAFFSTKQLALKMGMSYTPVREAIVRLATEGLVENIPKVGVRVKQLNRDELEEMFDLREAMESKAAERAALRITDEELQRIEMLTESQFHIIKQIRKEGVTSIEGNLMEKGASCDIALHLGILQASRSPRLLKIVSDMHILSQALRRRFIQPGETVMKYTAKLYRDHHRIVRSLKKHDAKEAGEWMRYHIRRAKEHHLAAYDWAHRSTSTPTEHLVNDWPEEILKVFRTMEDQTSTHE